MQLARVIGTVVATVKAPGLEGVKLLIVQPLDRRQQPSGTPVVAADAVHMAGPGELVYIVAAREAAEAMPDPFVPVDHAIVGIVDAVSLLRPDEGAAVNDGGQDDRAAPHEGEGAAPHDRARRRPAMKLARVVGTVVSTITMPALEDRTLLLCDLVAPDGRAAGGYLIAVDTVGAGAGETVLILDEGNSARQILGLRQGPIRTVVVGIVDDVAVEAEHVPGQLPVATPSGSRRTIPSRRTRP